MTCVLGLETAGDQSSVALVENETLVFEISLRHGRDLSRSFLAAVESGFELSGRRLSEVEAIAVSVGPGSFTGLRIGVTAAKTLAFALGVPTASISTLHTLAMAAASCSRDGLVMAVMDARRGEFFTSVFSCHHGRLERLSPDALVPEGELPGYILAHSMSSELDQEPARGITVVGAAELRSRLQGLPLHAPGGLIIESYPQARWVARLGLRSVERGETQDPVTLTPAYLRRTYAEEKAGEEGK